MRSFLVLLRHEIQTLFFAPATYITAILFMGSMGVLYLIALLTFSHTPREGVPSVLFFNLFWIPVLFSVPLLTMKSMAEERRRGTLQVMRTMPVSSWVIVLSKFMGAYLFYMLLWLLTVSFPLVVTSGIVNVPIDERLFDPLTWLGGYTFIAISGVLYIAIGISASSLTASQSVAGMLTLGELFFLIVGERVLMELPAFELEWPYLSLIDPFEAFDPLIDFTQGVIDTRPFIYYLSLAALALLVAVWAVEAKR